MPGSESYFAERGFKVGKSLRFNDDDTSELTRTFASAGNTKKWTFSCWVKRGNLDGESHTLFATDRSGTNDFDYIRIQTDDSVYAAVRSDAEEYHFRIITNRKLRDVGAWYHIVVRYDSTAGTPASPENALYINGELQDDLAAGVTPDQNDVSNFNNAVVHRIGSWNANAAFYLDGYLAEVNFVDGYSLPASYFGETDEMINQWIPIKYSGAYGSNGFYLPMTGTGLTASGGNSTGTYTAGGISYKYHQFTSSGTFTVSDSPPGANFDILVVGGGGGGGSNFAGAGGAGGMIVRPALSSSTGSYTVTIGSGGAGGAASASGPHGANGSDTTVAFNSSTILTAKGGGAGGGKAAVGADGGSAGGAGSSYGANHAGGSETQTGQSGDSGTYGFGNDGGFVNLSSADTPDYPTGGGGGAGGAGGDVSSSSGASGAAGVGKQNAYNGTNHYWAGGGGGFRYDTVAPELAAAAGGLGGGGGGLGRNGIGGAGGGSALNSGSAGGTDLGDGGAGGANTGGGGGASGGNGGSGIVIIRYAK